MFQSEPHPGESNMDTDEFVYDTDGYEYDDAHDYNYEESTTESTTDEENIEDPNHVQFNIRRTPMTHRCCFVCKKDCSIVKLCTVSNDCLIQLLIQNNIYIDPQNRCCAENLDDNRNLKKHEIQSINTKEKKIKFNYDIFKRILEGVRKRELTTQSIFARFRCLKTLNNDLCYQITGFTYQEFFLLNTMLMSLRNSPTRTKEQALAVYLFWLKTGPSQNIKALCFGLSDRNAIQKYCHSVRTALTKDFVPKYLGASSMTRECWILQNTNLTRDLYDLDDDQLALIADGKINNYLKPWFITHFNLYRPVLTCFEP